MRLALVTGALLLPASAARADALPEQSARTVSYEIDARLDWGKKRLDGRQVVTWRNQTVDVVSDVWLHLYWNAYRNAESTFAREWEGAKPPAQGEITIDRIRVRGGPPLTPRFAHPDGGGSEDHTVVVADLPEPVAPGGQVTIEIDWHSAIPEAGVRTGWGPGIVFAAQWYPALGVYQEGRGWNCHEHHAATEFFGEYGTFDVTLRAPSGWLVEATGRPQRVSGRTHRFLAEDVHDFAFVMTQRHARVKKRLGVDRPRFGREAKRLVRALGRDAAQMKLRATEIVLLVPPEAEGRTAEYFAAIEAGLELFGLRYGRYPYDRLTVVVAPKAAEFVCCMEYPTLITVAGGLVVDRAAIEMTVLHELGHQFFYGLVGSNEAETPWLDEGLTTYAVMRALETAYPRRGLGQRYLGFPVERFQPFSLPNDAAATLLGAGLLVPFGAYAGGPLAFARDAVPVAAWPHAAPPEPRSEGAPRGSLARYRAEARRGEPARVGFRHYDYLAYRVAAYSKPHGMLRSLERHLGRGTFDRVMRTYSERFRFQHPRGDDFERVAGEVGGRDLGWFFDQALRSTRVLDYAAGDVREHGKGKTRTTDVSVRRLGDFVAPVDVEVRFEGGAVRRERWDGADLFTRFRYHGMRDVTSVRVDPRRVWWLDVDRANDSWRRSPDRRAARRWSLRLLLWVQHAMRLAAGLS